VPQLLDPAGCTTCCVNRGVGAALACKWAIGGRPRQLPSDYDFDSVESAENPDSETWTVGPHRVHTLMADITRLPSRVGAIVSSDDNYLTAGGGVSKAIVSAAGASHTRDEMQALVWGPGGRQPSARSALKAGQVVYTTAGQLQADYVFHAIVIDHDRYQYPDRLLIAAVTKEALRLAGTLRLTSIAFPLLGTGTANLSPRVALKGMMDALADFAEAQPEQASIDVWILAKDVIAYHGLTPAIQQFAARLNVDSVLSGVVSEAAVSYSGRGGDLGSAEFDDGAPPVVRLQRLLSDRLESSSEVVTQVLNSRGYLGSFDDQLLEYCLDEDPLVLLKELLGKLGLITWGRELRIPDTELMDSSPHKLAHQILARIGFSLPPEPRGISGLINDVHSALESLESSHSEDVLEPSGKVRLGCQTALLAVLRFHGTVLLPAPFEASMRERQWLTSKNPLGKLTVGSLLDVLHNLVVGMETGDDRSAWSRHLQLFKGHSFFDDTSAEALKLDIGALNKPLHNPPSHEMRKEVQQAGKNVLRFLKYLKATGLYPPIISVTSWSVDAYGRRLVRAMDDSGMPHVIFTTDQLEPGHLYFMHPTTNPMRVNPVLVRLS
jgi:O-acetyl-ADP-ribose deacetylase (regulator of RNase III)